MHNLRVIVVEPKNPGNLGAIARLMKNFGLDDLIIVNAGRIPSEDTFRAMKGNAILSKSKHVESLEKAIDGLSFVTGTSGVKSDSPKGVLRNHIEPAEFGQMVSRLKGKVGIIFGREDMGLTNDELAMCDFFVHIPANNEYPILNVASAAAIIFYEIFRSPGPNTKETVTREEFDRLIGKFRENLVDSNYPSHRIEKTTLLFRRLISRATISPYEYRVLMGSIGCNRQNARDEFPKG